MKNDFKHKVVVVTGATGGIGRALSWRFAKAGARIVLLDLDEEQLSALQNQVERSGTEVMGMVCDVTNADRCEEVMREVSEHFGGIDVLVNNAGIAHYSLFADTGLDVMRSVMDVNFFGAINCTHAALPSLIERKGMIITLSSVLGLTPMVCRSVYSASKHALHGLFDTMRAELLEKGVDVLIACPSRTESDLHKHMLSGDGSIIEIEQHAEQASPTDVAEAIFIGAQKNKRKVVHAQASKLTLFLYQYFPAWFEYKTFKRAIKRLKTSA